ncbi:coiled-coil domain-containing protein 50 isoform X2 [Clupea harengus]|uniref:Coiled-coil domain-containing protein 50 isoform X2 n=1 Tax=Clupea harengus TaxID=7950 RepID=A0A6P8G6M3_CLUHA|nr:coiled-coil domain-containing protein 50 isoform X2 [Clupea harengus]
MREYYDEKGVHRIPSDTGYPSPENSRKKASDTGRRRYPEYDPPELGGPRLHASPGRDRHQDRRGRYPDHLPPEGRERQGEHRRGRGAPAEEREDEPVVRRKERPLRPPPPSYPTERDRDQEKDRDRRKDKERDRDGWRDGERPRERAKSRDRLEMSESDRDRHRDRDRDAERDRHGHKRQEELDWSRGRDGHETKDVHRGRGRDWEKERKREKRNHNGHTRSGERDQEERTGSWSEDEEARSRLRLPSGPSDVFEEPSSSRSPRRGERRETLDLDDDVQRVRSQSRELDSLSSSPLDRGRGGRGEFGVVEAQQGLSRMAVRDQELQELRDLEVARLLQEEELKASQMGKRHAQAAQVAQDEEIARMIMEEEKKVFKKSRDREREKPAMDRRKPEGDWKPATEEVVRPRSREEYDQQRARNHKPSRPARPRTPDYENVESSYGYPEPHYPPRPATRPDAAYKGSYYKQ